MQLDAAFALLSARERRRVGLFGVHLEIGDHARFAESRFLIIPPAPRWNHRRRDAGVKSTTIISVRVISRAKAQGGALQTLALKSSHVDLAHVV